MLDPSRRGGWLSGLSCSDDAGPRPRAFQAACIALHPAALNRRVPFTNEVMRLMMIRLLLESS